MRNEESEVLKNVVKRERRGGKRNPTTATTLLSSSRSVLVLHRFVPLLPSEHLLSVRIVLVLLRANQQSNEGENDAISLSCWWGRSWRWGDPRPELERFLRSLREEGSERGSVYGEKEEE